MRVGSLVFDTTQGLGLLAKAFYDNGVVTDPMVVHHGRRPSNRDWYPDTYRVTDMHSADQLKAMRELCASVDVMLFFETPFVWGLIDYCRSVGTMTVLMVMHECLHRENAGWHKPDLFLCPSLLDEKCVIRNVPGPFQTVFLPVPADVPWRQRTRAEVFVHNAGWGGLKGRNGTAELLQAMRLVKSPAKLLLRSQAHQDWPPYPELLGKVELVEGTLPQDMLWSSGDVFVFPETFNGLSLPLQEARAAGMLVMCGDRFPMNTWLPKEPIIPVKEYKRDQRTFPQFCPFDEAVYDPRDIAATIDAWYGRDITDYSLQGKLWAEAHSWEKLKPQYLQLLQDLVGSASRS